jgi:acetaldehyde dehydrogenase
MIKICILGTGQIGYDLLQKIMKLDFVEIVAFVGRRPATKEIPAGVFYSDASIDYFISNPKCCDVVFDCTDAFSAKQNSAIFLEQGIKVIDLTPSKIGEFYVPRITPFAHHNINMITCGGQVSIPFLHYINSKFARFEYVEVVTQINSESAGMATRINVDKYIETTEEAIRQFVRAESCKVILNINPSANTTMQTTMYIKLPEPENCCDISRDKAEAFADFPHFLENMQTYIKNYHAPQKPTWLSPNIIMGHVKIKGSGDYLSDYAGNLDIINCAAVHALKTIMDADAHV